MTYTLGAAFLACLLSLVLTPLCRNLSFRLGMVDQPDRLRKIHTRPVSRVGGVAIFAALAISMSAMAVFGPPPHAGGPDWSDVGRLVPALILVFATGLLDDLVGLSAWQKLTGQFAAAVLACLAGIQIESVAGRSIADTWWHAPLTVLWLVGCSNAFNLIDGIDGLATGVGLFATLTTLASAFLAGNSGLALATAPLAGALLGFLRYNFAPATIFLGDCGSLSVGFLLGCYGILWSQKSATLLGMTAPFIALCIPLLETAISMLRRFLRGHPIFGADRRHMHHRLLDLGLSPRGVALLMYGAAGLAAACSLLISVANYQFGGVVLILFCIVVWAGVHRLGYTEFEEARQVLFGGVIGRVINARLVLRQLETSLQTATSVDESWIVLTETSRKLGFSLLQLDLAGLTRSERLSSVPDSQCFQLRIPLNGHGVAEFSVPVSARSQPAALAQFADIVHQGLLSHARQTHADNAVCLPWPGARKSAQGVRRG